MCEITSSFPPLDQARVFVALQRAFTHMRTALLQISPCLELSAAFREIGLHRKAGFFTQVSPALVANQLYCHRCQCALALAAQRSPKLMTAGGRMALLELMAPAYGIQACAAPPAYAAVYSMETAT